MARLVKSSASPEISVMIQTILADRVDEVEYKIGDMITDLRYIENREIKTITGKLSKINFNNLMASRSYGSPETVRSFFASDVLPMSLEIDCSEQYDSNVVTIPCNEIIENQGVMNVQRMDTYMKYGVRFTSELTDGDSNDFIIWEGEDIQNLVYMQGGKDVTSNVRVVAFTYDANLVPLSVVVIENGATKTIDIIAIKDMGSVIHVTDVAEDLNSVLASAENGVVSLGSGAIESALTFPQNTTIRGAYAGIDAKSRKKNPVSFNNETILAGTITVPAGATLHLDGITLTKDAKIVTGDASLVVLENVIIESLVPAGASSCVINITDSTKSTKLNVKNCYFGTNEKDSSGNTFKNCFELTGPLADGSIISGCYFEKGIVRNNMVCFYHVEDGAHITLRDCEFEESINAVRVGTMEDVTVQYDFINNTYHETLEGDYAGFLLIQPYGTRTISMAKNVIRIVGLKNESGIEQIYYVYYNDSDTHMTPDKLPTLMIDGEVVMAPTAE